MDAIKFQLASDLHLEFLERDFPDARMIDPAPGADLLVLAGDIHHGAKAVEAFKDWPVPVILLAGNHEFYGLAWEQARIDIKRAAEATNGNVTFLDNDSVVIDIPGKPKTRFLGATMWTDFRIEGFRQSAAKAAVARALNDYHLIRTQSGTLRAQDTLDDHEQSRRWLEAELAKPFDGPTVVVTHHGCHPSSVHPRYRRDIVTAGFVSNLSELMTGPTAPEIWVHGHVHDSFEYTVDQAPGVPGTRVFANPAGYVLNARVARAGARTPETGFELENKRFNSALVIEVPAAAGSVSQGIASGQAD